MPAASDTQEREIERHAVVHDDSCDLAEPLDDGGQHAALVIGIVREELVELAAAPASRGGEPDHRHLIAARPALAMELREIARAFAVPLLTACRSTPQEVGWPKMADLSASALAELIPGLAVAPSAHASRPAQTYNGLHQ